MVVMTKRILSIIPARGGSKGLPRKNILNLAGKPLIAWTIEASLKSKYINKTIVSSEDKEILTISKQHGALTIERPFELASDTTSSELVIIHSIRHLESLGELFDIVILLQPTSPLRTTKHINEALELMLNEDAESVISVESINNKILKSFTISKSGYLQTISKKEYPFMRRQELPNTYASNGAIYISKTESFMRKRTFLSSSTFGYKMNADCSVDIDNADDILQAEEILKRNKT